MNIWNIWKNQYFNIWNIGKILFLNIWDMVVYSTITPEIHEIHEIQIWNSYEIHEFMKDYEISYEFHIFYKNNYLND